MTTQPTNYTTSAEQIAHLGEVAAHSAKLLRAMAPMTDSDARIDLANSVTDDLLRAIGRYVGGAENLKTVVDIALAD